MSHGKDDYRTVSDEDMSDNSISDSHTSETSVDLSTSDSIMTIDNNDGPGTSQDISDDHSSTTKSRTWGGQNITDELGGLELSESEGSAMQPLLPEDSQNPIPTTPPKRMDTSHLPVAEASLTEISQISLSPTKRIRSSDEDLVHRKKLNTSAEPNLMRLSDCAIEEPKDVIQQPVIPQSAVEIRAETGKDTQGCSTLSKDLNETAIFKIPGIPPIRSKSASPRKSPSMIQKSPEKPVSWSKKSLKKPVSGSKKSLKKPVSGSKKSPENPAYGSQKSPEKPVSGSRSRYPPTLKAQSCIAQSCRAQSCQRPVDPPLMQRQEEDESYNHMHYLIESLARVIPIEEVIKNTTITPWQQFLRSRAGCSTGRGSLPEIAHLEQQPPHESPSSSGIAGTSRDSSVQEPASNLTSTAPDEIPETEDSGEAIFRIPEVPLIRSKSASPRKSPSMILRSHGKPVSGSKKRLEKPVSGSKKTLEKPVSGSKKSLEKPVYESQRSSEEPVYGSRSEYPPTPSRDSSVQEPASSLNPTASAEIPELEDSGEDTPDSDTDEKSQSDTDSDKRDLK